METRRDVWIGRAMMGAAYAPIWVPVAILAGPAVALAALGVGAGIAGGYLIGLEKLPKGMRDSRGQEIKGLRRYRIK